MSNISSGKTIAKNTMLLYFRMLLTMAVSLYTSRVNLAALGIEDNGIYNVVGGVVLMFGFLNGALSGASSRFLTFELGRGNTYRLKETFSSILNVHIIVAIVVFALSETLGLWFLEYKLVIPESRMFAARVVYQVSIISTIFSITQVPYNASIISHEKMGVFASMSIISVTLKLVVSYSLYITPFDRLITFGVLVLLVSILMMSIYRFYCFRHFEECRFKRGLNQEYIKPILSFAGWDLMGNFSVMARNHGISMLMNIFFGPMINSAIGFSHTIGMSVLGFSNNFLTAIRPSIVKSYSQGQIEKMETLMINASNVSFSLLFILSTPFIFESTFIIHLWLETPPPYTDIFCKLELTLSVISSIFLPLVFAIHATSKIRFMSIVNGSIWLLVVPITWGLLRMGYDPVVPYVVKIFLLFFVVCSNLYSVKKNIPTFNIRLYLKKTLLPSCASLVLSLPIVYFVYSQFIGSTWIRFFTTCSVSTILIAFCSYFIVLDKDTRYKVKLKIFSFVRK